MQRGQKISSAGTQIKHISLIALVFGILTTFTPAHAAELIMFEDAGCAWCKIFDREIAPIYDKTDEGKRAPLRRVDVTQKTPENLAFIEVERLTPLFVLIDNGREIGRIRGYPGEDHFWGLLGTLLKKLDQPHTNLH